MTVKTPGRVHATLITDRRELAPGVVVLGFDAAELVRDARPGQYLMAIPPSGEACATALGIYEAEGRRASILFFVTGKRTRELAELRPGDRLDVLGPLGNGFDLSGGARDVAIVAGGVGLASVLLPAQWLVRAGARVRLFYGARSAKLSLEETFACGVGGCWGCVVPLARESAQAPGFPDAEAGGSDVVNARICKEGPVFWADELRW
jgi:NAD(P)H-flavin reductase